MSTTPAQKAMILDLWRKSRERQGQPAEIWDRIGWNWPSTTNAERIDIMEAYNQRRIDMKDSKDAPSSPKRPPKHVINCYLGERRYIESFGSTRAAKAFLDEIVTVARQHGDEKDDLKWKSAETATLKKGVLEIASPELEEIVEFDASGDDWKISQEMKNQIHAFMYGKWPERKVDDAPAPVATGQRAQPVVGEGGKSVGTTSLAAICQKNGWDAREARVAMRKAKWEKPAGSWAWDAKQVPQIERELAKILG